MLFSRQLEHFCHWGRPGDAVESSGKTNHTYVYIWEWKGKKNHSSYRLQVLLSRWNINSVYSFFWSFHSHLLVFFTWSLLGCHVNLWGTSKTNKENYFFHDFFLHSWVINKSLKEQHQHLELFFLSFRPHVILRQPMEFFSVVLSSKPQVWSFLLSYFVKVQEWTLTFK